MSCLQVGSLTSALYLGSAGVVRNQVTLGHSVHWECPSKVIIKISIQELYFLQKKKVFSYWTVIYYRNIAVSQPRDK